MEYGSDYTDYQRGRGRLRSLIRGAYLRSAAALVSGPTLDLGCGVGDLLKILPPGSRGLEYNKASVKYCGEIGLPVDWYDGFADDWRFSSMECRFESMVISHVLEHLHAPGEMLGKVLRSVRSLGISKVLVIVPGQAGFRSDPTHLTFVDFELIAGAIAGSASGFSIRRARYFPFGPASVGHWLVHHELQILCELPVEV